MGHSEGSICCIKWNHGGKVIWGSMMQNLTPFVWGGGGAEPLAINQDGLVPGKHSYYTPVERSDNM